MNNRWVALAAGCLIQTILGGIYAWSTFVPYLMNGYNLNAGQCGFIFGLTILVFTAVMIFSGWLLTKKGPRLTAAIGALLFMTGYLITSFSGGAYTTLLISLGVIAGAGIGFGYVCPLSVGMKWFPEKRGLVTGVAVAGFGGGAVLLSSVAEQQLHSGVDVLTFFRTYGIVAGLLLFGAAMLLSEPDAPKGATPKTHNMSAIFTAPFGLAALGIFCGTFAGLLIIGNLTPLSLKAGLTETQAAAGVSLFAVGNAAGRVSWGHFFDRLRYTSIPLNLITFALTAILLLIPLPSWLMLLTIALLGFGFGGNFVIYASVISRYFGAASFPRLYPVCFMAYGVAGIIGPGIGGFLADKTGSYNTALYICIALVSIAGILTFLKQSAFAPQKSGQA